MTWARRRVLGTHRRHHCNASALECCGSSLFFGLGGVMSLPGGKSRSWRAAGVAQERFSGRAGAGRRPGDLQGVEGGSLRGGGALQKSICVFLLAPAAGTCLVSGVWQRIRGNDLRSDLTACSVIRGVFYLKRKKRNGLELGSCRAPGRCHAEQQQTEPDSRRAGQARPAPAKRQLKDGA